MLFFENGFSCQFFGFLLLSLCLSSSLSININVCIYIYIYLYLLARNGIVNGMNPITDSII